MPRPPKAAKATSKDSTANQGFESHGGKLGDISIYGQDSLSAAATDEVKWARRQRPFGLATRARRVRLRRQQPKQSNATTRRLAIMNLAIRGIGKEHADTFRNVQHPDPARRDADYVLANPPFNPAQCGTNFAWVQHFIHHLAPQGMAGFVLANGSMSSNQSGEGDRISNTYPLCA